MTAKSSPSTTDFLYAGTNVLRAEDVLPRHKFALVEFDTYSEHDYYGGEPQRIAKANFRVFETEKEMNGYIEANYLRPSNIKPFNFIALTMAQMKYQMKLTLERDTSSGSCASVGGLRD